MRVLIVSTSDVSGGASVAARRLMYALRHSGMEATMLVREARSGCEGVARLGGRWRSWLKMCAERFVIWVAQCFRREGLFAVDIACTGYDVTRTPQFRAADVINLHWTNQGMLSLADLRRILDSGKPVVVTMHDMWYSTGVCHYSFGCTRYSEGCGHCAQLRLRGAGDLSARVFKAKSQLPLDKAVYVAVSSWLRQVALDSALTGGCTVRVVPNVIDLYTFRPLGPKAELRRRLGLPLDKTVLVMGAARLDIRIKGFARLVEALGCLRQKDGYFIVLMGGIKTDATAFLGQLCIPCKWMGHVGSVETMVQIYNAADVTVVPSLYETFGQTIIEGMACGCPAVTFDGSGQSDIIEHRVDGYLAAEGDIADFARGVEWAAAHRQDGEMAKRCIAKVRALYDEQVVAAQYMDVYAEAVRRTAEVK